MSLLRLYPSSLKTRVVLAVALLFVVFAGLLTWLTLRHYDQNFRERLYQEQFVLASTLAKSIDDKLRQAQDLLQRTARLLPPQALRDARVAQDFLDQQAALHGIYSNGLLLVSEQGRLIAESPYLPDRRGRDLSYRENFQVVSRTRQPYVSQPYASARGQGRPAVTISVPLFNEAGDPVGRLNGSLDLDSRNFLSDLNHVKLGRTGYVSLFTRERIFISNRNPQRILKPIVQPGLNPLVDRAIAGFEGSDTTITSRGEEVISSFKHLSTVPWLISLNLPVAEAEEALRETRSLLLLGITAGTLIVVILIWLIMRRALAPLATLTRHVQELPEKPGAARQLALHSGDESAPWCRPSTAWSPAWTGNSARCRRAKPAFAAWPRCRPTGTGSRIASSAFHSCRAAWARPGWMSTWARRAGRCPSSASRPSSGPSTAPSWNGTSPSATSSTRCVRPTGSCAPSPSAGCPCSMRRASSRATAASARISPNARWPSSASSTWPITTR